MVEELNSSFPYQWACIQALLNTAQKLRKRNHMVPFHDRLSMWTFISMMNCRNKHDFMYWEMTITACKYGSKACVSTHSESIYVGHLVSQRTLLNNISMFRDCSNSLNIHLTDTYKDVLCNKYDISIVAMYNNQRGKRIKYQHRGKGST